MGDGEGIEGCRKGKGRERGREKAMEIINKVLVGRLVVVSAWGKVRE